MPAPADPPQGRDGQRESPLETENWEEAASAAGTLQETPTHTLSRPPPRRRTEGALYSCTALLAAVALGLDIRELPRVPAAEEAGPREERKKREGILQRAPWPRGAADRPRASATLPPPGALGLLSRPSLSTKCLLQAEGRDSLEGSAHSPGAPDDVPTLGVCPAAGGCQPTSPPRHEAESGVWRHLGPPSSELPRGDAPPCASLKKRAASHRRTVSDGNASLAPGRRPEGRYGHHCRRQRVTPHLGLRQAMAFPSVSIYRCVSNRHTGLRILPYAFLSHHLGSGKRIIKRQSLKYVIINSTLNQKAHVSPAGG